MRGLQSMGPKVSWESQINSQKANLAKGTVWRGRQNEIESGKLDRAQGTGQSKRVLDRLGVGAQESSQATGILSPEGKEVLRFET